MGYRLSKIYTRTGDAGTTGLNAATRVPKDAPAIALLGDLDELNSALGLVIALGVYDAVAERLRAVQSRLFDVGAELSVPERAVVADAHVEQLEGWLDEWNDRLPPLREFILPGGTPAAAACHLARAVARRAERSAATLLGRAELRPVLAAYLNRLSDLLFVAARVIARDAGAAEPQWQPDVPKR